MINLYLLVKLTLISEIWFKSYVVKSWFMKLRATATPEELVKMEEDNLSTHLMKNDLINNNSTYQLSLMLVILKNDQLHGFVYHKFLIDLALLRYN